MSVKQAHADGSVKCLSFLPPHGGVGREGDDAMRDVRADGEMDVETGETDGERTWRNQGRGEDGERELKDVQTERKDVKRDVLGGGVRLVTAGRRHARFWTLVSVQTPNTTVFIT